MDARTDEDCKAEETTSLLSIQKKEEESEIKKGSCSSEHGRLGEDRHERPRAHQRHHRKWWWRNRMRMFEGSGPLDRVETQPGQGYGTLPVSRPATAEQHRRVDQSSSIYERGRAPRKSLLDRLWMIRRYDEAVCRGRGKCMGRLPMLPRTRTWRVGEKTRHERKLGIGNSGSVVGEQIEEDVMSLEELIVRVVRRRESRCGEGEARAKARFYIKAGQWNRENLYCLPESVACTETTPLLPNGGMVDCKIDLEAGEADQGGNSSPGVREDRPWLWDQLVGTVAIVVFFITLYVLWRRECEMDGHC